MIHFSTPQCLLITSSLLRVVTSIPYYIPNLNATFSDSPQPFRVDVDPTFIDLTYAKVRDSRAPFNTEDFPYSDGPVISNWTSVQDEWSSRYDWRRIETDINNNLTQFTTVVNPVDAPYDEPVPLHFVHHRSPRPDAIPMLWIHGWPSSFLEVSKLIPLLTNPPNATLPAFHVIAPSIPGFGFSPPPTHPGFGPIAAAYAFNALMLQLGYTQYVGQGGDVGAIILRALAVSHPANLVSLLSNFWPVQPNSTDLSRLASNQTTREETSYINRLLDFQANYFSYGAVQSTTPLSIAYATTDSPMGLAMWIFQLMRLVTDTRVFTWTPTEIITWTYMYWIQGPYSSFRMYKESVPDGFSTSSGIGPGPGYVGIPTAIAEFPFDIWYDLPLEWAQRDGDVRRRYMHDFGGHFPAYEVPEILAMDIWDWFGDQDLSGTRVFGR